MSQPPDPPPTATKGKDGPRNLATLPPELLRVIALYLPEVDLCIFRKTCRNANLGVLGEFGCKFFGKRGFEMLNEQALEALQGLRGLQGLVKLSEHPAFAKSVKHVVFNHGINFIKAWDAEEGSKPAGHDRALLAKAFSKLPNIKQLDCRVRRDLEHDRGPPPEVTHLDKRDMEDKLMNHYFSVVLSALTDARIPPRSVELGFFFDSWSSHDIAFRAPLDLMSSLGPLLSRLVRISLSVDLSDPESRLDEAPHLRRFLSVPTGVLTLSLIFHCEDFFDASSFIRRLCLPPDSELHQDPFPVLQHLSLSLVVIKPVDMLLLITTVKATLQSLELAGCTLLDGDNELSDEVDIWTPFLKSIAQETNLRRFMLNHARITDDSDPTWLHVSFERLRQDGEGEAERLVEVQPVRYDSEDVSTSIAALAEMVCIAWR